MKIKITRISQSGDRQFCADRPEVSGSPSIGYGKTPKEALGDLIYNIGQELGFRLQLPLEEKLRIKQEYLDNSMRTKDEASRR